jgi:hypothetical protein
MPVHGISTCRYLKFQVHAAQLQQAMDVLDMFNVILKVRAEIQSSAQFQSAGCGSIGHFGPDPRKVCPTQAPEPGTPGQLPFHSHNSKGAKPIHQ